MIYHHRGLNSEAIVIKFEFFFYIQIYINDLQRRAFVYGQIDRTN